MRPIHKCVRKFGHTPVCHSARDFAILEHSVQSRTVPKPIKLVFDHHKITNKPHNIQIRLENRTKPVSHYTTPRRKITSVGGNLPLVAQFRVLCSPGLLTAQHSFLFLFIFPLFLPFFFPFLLSFLISFPPFLLSFLPFLFSFPPPSPSLPSSSPCCSHRLILSSLLLLPTDHVSPLYRHGKEPCMLTQGMPCVTHMASHVSHTCKPLPGIVTHGLSCVTHMACHVSPHCSPCVARHAFPEIREIPIISEFNKIRLGS